MDEKIAFRQPDEVAGARLPGVNPGPGRQEESDFSPLPGYGRGEFLEGEDACLDPDLDAGRRVRGADEEDSKGPPKKMVHRLGWACCRGFEPIILGEFSLNPPDFCGIISFNIITF